MRVAAPRPTVQTAHAAQTPAPVPSTAGVRASWLRGGARETTWGSKSIKATSANTAVVGLKRKSQDVGEPEHDRAQKLARKASNLELNAPQRTVTPNADRQEEEDDDDNTGDHIKRLTMKLKMKNASNELVGVSPVANESGRPSADKMDVERTSSSKNARGSRESRLSVSHLVAAFDKKPSPAPAQPPSDVAKLMASTTPTTTPPRSFSQPVPKPTAAIPLSRQASANVPSSGFSIFKAPTSIFTAPSINKPLFTQNNANANPPASSTGPGFDWQNRASIFSSKPPPPMPSSQTSTIAATMESQTTVTDSIFDLESQPMSSQAMTSFHFSQQQQIDAPKDMTMHEATFTGWGKYRDDDGDVDEWVQPLPGGGPPMQMREPDDDEDDLDDHDMEEGEVVEERVDNGDLESDWGEEPQVHEQQYGVETGGQSSVSRHGWMCRVISLIIYFTAGV